MAELRTVRLSNVNAPTSVSPATKAALAGIQQASTRAACRVPGEEDELDRIFFPSEGRGGDSRPKWAPARRICDRCPLTEACLELAISLEGGRSAGYRFGMFGGKSPTERFNLYRSRAQAARGDRKRCE